MPSRRGIPPEVPRQQNHAISTRWTLVLAFPSIYPLTGSYSQVHRWQYYARLVSNPASVSSDSIRFNFIHLSIPLPFPPPRPSYPIASCPTFLCDIIPSGGINAARVFVVSPWSYRSVVSFISKVRPASRPLVARCVSSNSRCPSRGLDHAHFAHSSDFWPCVFGSMFGCLAFLDRRRVQTIDRRSQSTNYPCVSGIIRRRCQLLEVIWISFLTLSLPRVINFKFPLQPHQKYYITKYEEPVFSYLTKWKTIILSISHTSPMHLSLRDWENALVELGRERVKFRSHAEACIIPGTSLQMIAHLMYLSATRATGLDNIRTKGPAPVICES